MAAIYQAESKRPVWQTAVIFTLAFWLSATAILDFVFMPALYAAGMMTQPGFVTAGYSLFWVFNRLELLCAGLALTGALVLYSTHCASGSQGRTAIILSALLLAVTLVDTYALTPYMSALGLQLNLFEPVAEIPVAMNQMHGSYWVLEALKLAAAGSLLALFYRQESVVK
jgi:hypothetical protein